MLLKGPTKRCYHPICVRLSIGMDGEPVCLETEGRCDQRNRKNIMNDEQLNDIEAQVPVEFKHLTIILDGRDAQEVIKDLIAMARKYKKIEQSTLHGMNMEEVVQNYPQQAIRVMQGLNEQHEMDKKRIAAFKDKAAKLREVYKACQELLRAVYIGDGKVLCPPAIEPSLRLIVKAMDAYKNRGEDNEKN